MTEIVLADLSCPQHAAAVVPLLNEYAKDIMGGGQDLSDVTKENLVRELKQRPNCCIVLAFVEAQPAGMAICFEGFSTFACQATLNIHDLLVAPEYRGRGLSKSMLAKVEEVATERGCCKLTLEVLEGNKLAQQIYQKFGFEGYELDSAMGRAMFFEKKLSDA